MSESKTKPIVDVNGNEPSKSFADEFANLTIDKLVRGGTIENIEQRCLELCQTYIGGSWNNAKTKEDVTVKRISGGLTNQLYHIHLNESVLRIPNTIYPNEPSDVAIKLYQPKHMKNYNQEDAERLNDTLVLTIFGQKGLGPEIYGIFADGFIQGYYEHEQFRAKHQDDAKLTRQVMSLLARINHLRVPMRKESNLLFKGMRGMIEFGYANCKIQEHAEELNLKTLKEFNVMAEYEELMSRIDQLNAPVVFTHNDFRGNNLLVTKFTGEKEQRVLSVDMEYCGYGTRGFDFASLVLEWGQTDVFDALNAKFPNESLLRTLLKVYIEEVDKVVPGYSTKPENSLDMHLAEVRVMLLAVNMFLVAFMIKQTESFITAIPFDLKKNAAFVENFYARYMELKNLMLEKGEIQKLD